eukprot:9757-Heterococcus_DN1.PRE.1
MPAAHGRSVKLCTLGCVVASLCFAVAASGLLLLLLTRHSSFNGMLVAASTLQSLSSARAFTSCRSTVQPLSLLLLLPLLLALQTPSLLIVQQCCSVTAGNCSSHSNRPLLLVAASTGRVQQRSAPAAAAPSTNSVMGAISRTDRYSAASPRQRMSNASHACTYSSADSLACSAALAAAAADAA